METWLIITLILLMLAILIILLVIKNRKDEKEFEEQIKQDYHKSRPRDVETEGTDSV